MLPTPHQRIASQYHTGLDGERLHHELPAAMWGISLRSLLRFRSDVEKAIASQLIQSTEREEVHLEDKLVGPTVYLINDQLIKPVTTEAGQVSWALMCSPEGCECDLFISHAWLEGILEFLSAVCATWPRKAKGAYCCMLSNPQCLDISALIQTPQNSPFAHALRSSTYVCVVPNTKICIYNRLWCGYEGYLAYDLGKNIYTAMQPLPLKKG